jgi:putative dehydrogenase
MAQRVGVVGLGIMGSAYAGHLVDAGYATTGFDVAPDALRRFEELGGSPAADPRAVARDADVVITALPSVAAMEAAFFGADGLAAGAHAGLVVVEASTLPLAAKERCRDGMAARGAVVLDAPVSGTGSQRSTAPPPCSRRSRAPCGTSASSGRARSSSTSPTCW